jgi:hypothetical protein
MIPGTLFTLPWFKLCAKYSPRSVFNMNDVHADDSTPNTANNSTVNPVNPAFEADGVISSLL